MSVGTVQNFTSIFQTLFELQLFEYVHRSHFKAPEFATLYFLQLLTGNNFSSVADTGIKFAGFVELVTQIQQQRPFNGL